MTTPCFLVEEIDADGPAHHWRRLDTGEVLAMRPPGAMWTSEVTERRRPTGPDDWPDDADTLARVRETFRDHPTLYPGPSDADPTLPKTQPSFTFADGEHLWVQTPGGSWCIDSRASNCTMPYDYAHRCWVRHGELPNVTVDKAGVTCSAGAGSIKCGTYHGFLRDGVLTDG